MTDKLYLFSIGIDIQSIVLQFEIFFFELLDFCFQCLNLILILPVLNISCILLFFGLFKINIEFVIHILEPKHDFPQSLAVLLKHALQNSILFCSQPSFKYLDIGFEFVYQLIFLA